MTDPGTILRPCTTSTAEQKQQTSKVREKQKSKQNTATRGNGRTNIANPCPDLVYIDHFFGGVHAVIVLPIAVLLILGRPHPATVYKQVKTSIGSTGGADTNTNLQ